MPYHDPNGAPSAVGAFGHADLTLVGVTLVLLGVLDDVGWMAHVEWSDEVGAMQAVGWMRSGV